MRSCSIVGVAAGRAGNNLYPEFVVERIPGIYRIVFGSVVDFWDGKHLTWGADIALEHHVSHRFVLDTLPR